MVDLPRKNKPKKEPGLRVNQEPGLVTPIIIPPSREVTIVRLGKDAENGCLIINAPKHVEILKRDKRPRRR
jgi:hypothetical protein